MNDFIIVFAAEAGFNLEGFQPFDQFNIGRPVVDQPDPDNFIFYRLKGHGRPLFELAFDPYHANGQKAFSVFPDGPDRAVIDHKAPFWSQGMGDPAFPAGQSLVFRYKIGALVLPFKKP